jgi:hypothetical protein
MKTKRLIVLASAFSVLITAGVSAREFKSADGSKTMSGTITGVSTKGRTATIRRIDGSSITFPLSAVSESDQEFVREWFKSREAGRKLALTFNSSDEKGQEKKTSNARQYKVHSQYTVGIRNNAAFTVDGVELRYRLFIARDKAKGGSVDETKDGVIKMDELPSRGEIQMATESVSLNVQKPLPSSQCAGGT